ncbi:hypothetical protein SAMN05428982_2993 [Pseudoxanthomonas sp. CF385]|uniref:hypothetical protein n=1 Tax=Pseudoxanthomonas sp. CF385 TaxID=1881042 RepID=UPI00088904C4|nr:hypothetical protein [Pseudoxanthomonas sp. CF385]SDR03584.1 hypothetical protein SAMN05428982_2993 [Pseudoxanthomonas sp. CF385]
MPSNIVEAFKNLDSAEDYFSRSIDSGPSENALASTKNLANSAHYVAHVLAGVAIEDELRELVSRLKNSAQEYLQRIDSDEAFYQALTPPRDVGRPVAMQRPPSSATAEHREDLESIARRMDAIASSHRDLEAATDGLRIRVDEAIRSTSEAYAAAQLDIDQKKDQIDKILGHVSGRTLAGDFDKNAAVEKRNADWLRYSSVFCMALTVALVSYTFYESAFGSFDWKLALSRIAMALFLSVPAGYLARESSRHRLQQQLYLQTSLSLKALPAYIASLPDEMQHKLKAEMTQRIFSMSAGPQGELGVLNAQDLILELIKRLDLKRS